MEVHSWIARHTKADVLCPDLPESGPIPAKADHMIFRRFHFCPFCHGLARSRCRSIWTITSARQRFPRSQ